jgi:nucleotidyltransferase substrate binding protein (TIGR01987 family)
MESEPCGKSTRRAAPFQHFFKLLAFSFVSNRRTLYKVSYGRHHLMSKDRFAERKSELQNAVKRLREAAAQPQSDLVRDAVIQRFEFTFELVWKSLKLYLERQGLDCGGPRSTLKQAFTEGLVNSPDEADVWLRMLDDRNLTSHAYNEALAARIYGHIVQEYAAVLAQMADRVQALSWD